MEVGGSQGCTCFFVQSVLERDGTLVKDAGTFLVESVIPRFIRDCIQLTLTPTDGETLTMALHARGINMRYLGRVALLASLRKDLHHIKVRGHMWLL